MLSALRLRAPGTHNLLDRNVHVAADELTFIVPLPETRAEVETISELLAAEGEPVQVCLGADARESLLKQMDARGTLASNRYLHFATHAVLPNQIGDVHEPSLLLSLYGDTGNDGVLTLSEIFAFTLDADMVTLSACWSGYVRPDAYADGLSGLARAFFCAGARRVTVSMWSLEDTCGQRMMAGFYRAMRETAPLAALNRAKRTVLREREFAHPCFWSGLVMLGEWR
jgi:CHAT domain-containing protein